MALAAPVNEVIDAPKTQIAEYSPVAAGLAELRTRLSNVVYDVTTADGMARARRDRRECVTLRTSLESVRVREKADILARGRLLDGEAARIRGEIEAIEDPIDAQIKAEETRREIERAAKEQAERERIAGVHAAIAETDAIAAKLTGKPSADIAAALEKLRQHFVGEWAFEFKELAQAAKDRAVAALEQLFTETYDKELAAAAEAERVAAERIELARLRAEQDERDRHAAEKRAKDAEEEAARRKVIADAERASREKIEAEELAARLAREEADRIAKAARDAEQKKIEENERAARLQRAEDDRKAEAARAAERKRLDDEAAARKIEQDRVDAEMKAERDRLDAVRRETERLQNELLDGRAMLTKFVDRFGKRREFAAVVKAIKSFLEVQA